MEGFAYWNDVIWFVFCRDILLFGRWIGGVKMTREPWKRVRRRRQYAGWEVIGVWPRVLAVEIEIRCIWDKFWKRAAWTNTDRPWEVKGTEGSRMTPGLWLSTCLLGNLWLSSQLHCVLKGNNSMCCARGAHLSQYMWYSMRTQKRIKIWWNWRC